MSSFRVLFLVIITQIPIAADERYTYNKYAKYKKYIHPEITVHNDELYFEAFLYHMWLHFSKKHSGCKTISKYFC